MRLAFRRSNDSADSPPYLSLLNLHTPPFSGNTGSEFFYADAEREQYLNMMQHLTQYSEELLLVVGDEGTGKSALLEKYLERREEHWHLCRLAGEQGVDLDTLFTRVAECLGVDLGNVEAAQLLDALRQHLDGLLEQQLSVLVIDDAHMLSDDALEMVFHLAALEGEQGKLIRVLLFADSAMETKLAFPRFSKIEAPHRLNIKALEEGDSSAYILHRLQQAGYSGPSPFSANELKQLHRQSRGVPAKLNQAAHEMLLARSKGESTPSELNRRRVKVGLAATALIGTVLGMHERINAMLGGETHNSMALTAERPVLRLADQDNPWAVVIRDGESIQISCGPPAAQTVAVRPIPASKPIEAQPVMQQPLLQPISIPEPEAAPAPEEVEALPEAPAEIVEAELPAEEAVTPPLVVKPPQPDITPELPPETVAAEEAAEEEPPAEPQKLSLDGISPDPVIGSEEPQTVTILGSGLVAGSKVAVSWSGKVEVLDPSKLVVLDAGHMELELTTGVEAATWAVQVSTPDNQRSNVLRFQVEAPKPEVEEVKEAMEPETAAEKADETAPAEAEPALVEKVAPPVTEPAEKIEKVKAPELVKPVAKKPETPKGQKIQGSSWIAAQSTSNYTLQLLASSERDAPEKFVTAHPQLKAPLARFEQQKGKSRLYVLAQGSYPSRTAAEAAARSLPAGIKPWIRDFAGIKKVMKAPVSTKQKVSTGKFKDTAWVWSQKPGHHTIQVAGASNEEALEAVMRGISLPGELAVVQTMRKGKPWYSLIYGSFATRKAAQGTVGRLPESLKKAGPWVRRFSAIQDEIGQAPGR